MAAQGANADEVIAGIVRAWPLRAAGFIVSVYGDAIGPRGGAVWVGALIGICAEVGISETLVRTAVSRLVGAGRLQGRRRGRRSYYRLTEATRAEFDAAARIIYGPPERGGRWRFVHLPEVESEVRMAALERAGYARLRPHLAVGPARGPAPEGVLCFESEVGAGVGAGVGGDPGLLRDFVARVWDLEPHAQAYRAFQSVFAALDGPEPDPDPKSSQNQMQGQLQGQLRGQLRGQAKGSMRPRALALRGAQALAARLLLVHAWRQVVLHDPRLPSEALPPDWPGAAARALFARVYRRLTPEAESHLDALFDDALFDGGEAAVAGVTAIQARLDLLRGAAIAQKAQDGEGGAGARPDVSQIGV